MIFYLFWIDFFIKDKLFGIGLLTFKFEELVRSFFCIYWNDGELLIDLLWFRIVTTAPYMWFYKDPNEPK